MSNKNVPDLSKSTYFSRLGESLQDFIEMDRDRRTGQVEDQNEAAIQDRIREGRLIGELIPDVLHPIALPAFGALAAGYEGAKAVAGEYLPGPFRVDESSSKPSLANVGAALKGFTDASSWNPYYSGYAEGGQVEYPEPPIPFAPEGVPVYKRFETTGKDTHVEEPWTKPKPDSPDLLDLALIALDPVSAAAEYGVSGGLKLAGADEGAANAAGLAAGMAAGVLVPGPFGEMRTAGRASKEAIDLANKKVLSEMAETLPRMVADDLNKPGAQLVEETMQRIVTGFDARLPEGEAMRRAVLRFPLEKVEIGSKPLFSSVDNTITLVDPEDSIVAAHEVTHKLLNSLGHEAHYTYAIKRAEFTQSNLDYLQDNINQIYKTTDPAVKKELLQKVYDNVDYLAKQANGKQVFGDFVDDVKGLVKNPNSPEALAKFNQKIELAALDTKNRMAYWAQRAETFDNPGAAQAIKKLYQMGDFNPYRQPGGLISETFPQYINLPPHGPEEKAADLGSYLVNAQNRMSKEATESYQEVESVDNMVERIFEYLQAGVKE